MFKEIKELVESVDVSRLWRAGAYTQNNGETKLFVAYHGGGLDAAVHNKEYDNIVDFTETLRDLELSDQEKVDRALELVLEITESSQYRLLEKRFSDSYIVYDASLIRAEASTVAEKCFPAVKIDRRMQYEPEYFFILISELGEYEEYTNHPMIGAIAKHIGGSDALRKKLLKLS